MVAIISIIWFRDISVEAEAYIDLEVTGGESIATASWEGNAWLRSIIYSSPKACPAEADEVCVRRLWNPFFWSLLFSLGLGDFFQRRLFVMTLRLHYRREKSWNKEIEEVEVEEREKKWVWIHKSKDTQILIQKIKETSLKYKKATWVLLHLVATMCWSSIFTACWTSSKASSRVNLCICFQKFSRSMWHIWTLFFAKTACLTSARCLKNSSEHWWLHLKWLKSPGGKTNSNTQKHVVKNGLL